MDFIRRQFSIIPLRVVKEFMRKEDSSRRVVITFDDAFVDFYELAYPLLEEFKIPSTVFVPTGFIGGFNDWDFPFNKCHRKSVMSAHQIQELNKTGLVDFGSHTIDHLQMNKLDVDEMRRQLTGSKKALEDMLSTSVTMFSYPYGGLRDFSPLTARILRETGYEIGVTAHWGTRNSAQDILHLRRIYLKERDSSRTMKSKIEGRHDWIPLLKQKAVSGIRALNSLVRLTRGAI
jgi:peptidoglycan/xylan/chitin deacetylase (PgdA/CDA1 family)